MFSLTISFGPAATMWTMMFKDAEKAEAAFSLILQAPPVGPVIVEDDFGQRACIGRSEIRGVMLEDMEQSKLAHIERALYQARMQAKASEMAESDNSLRASRARQGGPAIIAPFGGNGQFPR